MKRSPRAEIAPAVTNPPADRWPLGAVFSLLLLATFIAYLPSLRGDFLWDDPGHVTSPALQPWSGLLRIWFEPGVTQQYYPLLHSAFWFEHQLWGDATLGYRLVNVLAHATTATLLIVLLRRLAVPGALFAGLLFALHPVCVESVAWISEQKNTLSAVFYLGAALAYLEWHGRPAHESEVPPASRRPSLPLPAESRRYYLVASFLFVCALLTKSVTATLPAALLVVLWWKNGRLSWRGDALPLVPWFAAGIGAGLFTVWFERVGIGAQGSDFSLSLIERALLAGRVVWFYLGQLVWPADLTFFYPRWDVDATVWWQWLFPLAAIALLYVLWRLARSEPQSSAPETGQPVGRGVPAEPSTAMPLREQAEPRLTEDGSPYHDGSSRRRGIRIGSRLWTLSSGLSPRARRAPLAGALLFGGTLFPVLGFVNVYPFVFSYVADHFQYHASLSVFALAGAGFVLAGRQGRLGLPWRGAQALAGVVILLLGVLTWQQSKDYVDSVTLYRATLARNPDSWVAHHNLASELTARGATHEALLHAQRAVALKPDFPEALNNLADNLTQVGRAAEALPLLERALQLQPRYAQAENTLGVALIRLGRTEEGVRHFERAIALEPKLAEAHYNLGLAHAERGAFATAIPFFAETVRLKSDHAGAELNWAVALALTDRLAEARLHFARALELDPASAPLRQTYGRLLLSVGEFNGAAEQLYEALQLDPNLPGLHRDLAFVLERLGHTEEARQHALEASRQR